MLPSTPSPFITRVVLSNYKNISHCDVPLEKLTFLVGPNGSGKSNFLDALHFVEDVVSRSLDYALERRNGILNVLSAFASPEDAFGIRLDFKLTGERGHYSFLVTATAGGGYSVVKEECVARSDGVDPRFHYFTVENGKLDTNDPMIHMNAQPLSHQLLISHGLSFPNPFTDLSHSLLGMYFYNIQPEAFRNPTSSTFESKMLGSGGENLSPVLRRLSVESPESVERILSYLTRIVPTVSTVRSTIVGGMQTLEFPGVDDRGRLLLAPSMSSGTLRILGILVSLFQTPEQSDYPLTLIGIEEPEATVHPAAAGVLLDALKEASETRQVLVTSHSPDLLDDKRLDAQSILAFDVRGGMSKIGHLDEVGVSVIRDRLSTPGELLRVNQLHLDAHNAQVGSDLLFGE